MDKPGPPLLAGAFICERVLSEVDGTHSAIRIIDSVRHVAIGPEPPESMPPVALPLFMVLGIYADSAAKTRYEFGLSVIPPGGEPQELGAYEVETERDGQPGWAVVQLQFTALHEGTYWFPVAVNGTPLTRVPLRIEYQRQVMAPAAEES